MKKYFISVITATLLIYVITYSANNIICNNFVRIHIIADSDEPYDQIIKMGVRNYIFSKYENAFSKFRSKNDSLDYLRNNLGNIWEDVEFYLENNGYSKKARVYISHEHFPSKNYGKFILPEGNYSALRIVIGEGKGKNFFCVMYPPLCVSQNVKPTNDSKQIIYKSEIAEYVNHILR